MMGGSQGRSNAGGFKPHAQSRQDRPRYSELCVGMGRCVAVETCSDVVAALSVLGIDETDLAELVVRAVCGVSGQ